MSRPDGPLLVLGIGNVLLRDEGVGVRVVRELECLAERDAVHLPAGTSLVDGGTRGLDLLPLITDARAVVIVDAMDLGLAAGAVDVVRGDALFGDVPSGAAVPGARGGAASAGPNGVRGLLDLARLMGTPPAAVSLVGVQPSGIAVGTELTEVVQQALPAAVATTLSELRRLDATVPSPGSGRAVRGQEATEAMA
jgi:hydrogenase maturation protease